MQNSDSTAVHLQAITLILQAKTHAQNNGQATAKFDELLQEQMVKLKDLATVNSVMPPVSTEEDMETGTSLVEDPPVATPVFQPTPMLENIKEESENSVSSPTKILDSEPEPSDEESNNICTSGVITEKEDDIQTTVTTNTDLPASDVVANLMQFLSQTKPNINNSPLKKRSNSPSFKISGNISIEPHLPSDSTGLTSSSLTSGAEFQFQATSGNPPNTVYPPP